MLLLLGLLLFEPRDEVVRVRLKPGRMSLVDGRVFRLVGPLACCRKWELRLLAGLQLRAIVFENLDDTPVVLVYCLHARRGP